MDPPSLYSWNGCWNSLVKLLMSSQPLLTSWGWQQGWGVSGYSQCWYDNHVEAGANLGKEDCLGDEDDVPPVGHDLDSGDDAYWSKKPRPRHRSWDMQRRAAKRNEYNQNIVRIPNSRVGEIISILAGHWNSWNILLHHNSINKRAFNLEFIFLARFLRREVDPVSKMVVGVGWREGAVGQKDQFLPQMPSPSVCLMSPYNRTRPNLSSGTSPYPHPKQIMNPVCLFISQVPCQNDLTCERGNKTIDQSHSGRIKLLQGGN